MDSIVYKVIFKALQQFENKNLTLNFRDLNFEKPLTIPSELILKLKDRSDKSEKIIYFQNIEEVITVGNTISDIDYNYYLVVLFTLNSTGEKQGYLIGNVKNLGDIILGIWPFNYQVSSLTPKNVRDKYKDLLNNPENYNKICVISQ